MNLKIIRGYSINFVESAARKEFRYKNSKNYEEIRGGEVRLFCGKDEKMLDKFFDFDKVESFIIYKNDLISYLKSIESYFLNPIYKYPVNISDMYDSLMEETLSISKEFLTLQFEKKYDNKNRYYLELKKDSDNRKNYNYIRNITLPTITEYDFTKYKNADNNKIIIVIKPVLIEKDESNQKSCKSDKKYREEVLDNMPVCIFTKVRNENLLQACHIKPKKKCKRNEKYDSKNGITMTPTYHILFDKGLISFDDNFKLLISPYLQDRDKRILGLSKKKQFKELSNVSKKYLEYHRENIFKDPPKSITID